ncbi:MAG: hypothetical protein ACTSVA_00140 [Candidatus Njordarchaeales archaeon]
MMNKRVLMFKCPTCGEDIHTEVDLSEMRKEEGGIYSLTIVHGTENPHIVIVYLDENGSIRGVESFDKVIALNIERTERMAMMIAGKKSSETRSVEGYSVKVSICPKLKSPDLIRKVKNPIEARILAQCDGRHTVDDIKSRTGLPMEIVLFTISKYANKKWIRYVSVIKKRTD